MPTVGRLASLAAAMVLTAHTEHALAAAIGVPDLLAWLFPVALDLYAAAAFRAHARRDIGAAVALMIGCQTLAHLLAADIITAGAWLVIPVSCVVPVVLWRGHTLGDTNPTTPPAPEPAPNVPAAANEAAPVAGAVTPPVPAPAPVTPTRPAASRRKRRTAAETRDAATALTTMYPQMTRVKIAERLGISDRYLRTVLNAA